MCASKGRCGCTVAVHGVHVDAVTSGLVDRASCVIIHGPALVSWGYSVTVVWTSDVGVWMCGVVVTACESVGRVAYDRGGWDRDDSGGGRV